MNPFLFASRERALFGVYHPPRPGRTRYRGAVLCYPFGIEYMRAHRAFRQLTALLSRAGFHVLRFDYFGTGDSAGHGDEASLARWRSDVGEAITELRETAGLEGVTLIGLRLGAALAVEAAAQRTDVEQIVAWDPVVSGSGYLEELLAQTDPGDRAEGAVTIRGFSLPATMATELRSLDLTAVSRTVPVHLVSSRKDPSLLRFRVHLMERDHLAGHHVHPGEEGWLDGDLFGSVLLPGTIVRTIVRIMEEGGSR